MFATSPMTHALATAVVVAAVALTAGFALSRHTVTRVSISPLLPLTCWLVAGGATVSTSFMLPGTAEWFITTIRLLGGLGACIIITIMYMIVRERSRSKEESFLVTTPPSDLMPGTLSVAARSSADLPLPYVTGHRARLPTLPQSEGLPLPLPYAA